MGCAGECWWKRLQRHHDHEIAGRLRTRFHSQQDLRDLLLQGVVGSSAVGGITRARLPAGGAEFLWRKRYVDLKVLMHIERQWQANFRNRLR